MTKQCLFAGAIAITLHASAAFAALPEPWQAAPQAEASAAEDYSEVASAANALIRAHHYDPSALDKPAYRAMEAKVAALGRDAKSRDAFVSGFNALWRDGPFSHVNLSPARASAEDTAAYLDQMRVGKGARLDWRGDVAVLTVNTMMGADTIEQIDAAYGDIAERGARGLVIDLRKNPGGAFAVRPLVEHLITAPVDTGVFLSREWSNKTRRPPNRGDIAALKPWEGWSLRAFWRDIEAAPLTRVRFLPKGPTYSGPVFVLIGPGTASAAELAADAIAASGRGVLVGERTKGQMLSQKPFDLPRGLQLFLPIADYQSFRSGRIEGAGLAPDIAVEATKALDEALAKAGVAPGG